MRDKNVFSMPDEIVALVNIKLEEISNLIKPYLNSTIKTSTHDAHELADNTFPFEKKCLDYYKSHPEFAPAYIDYDQMEMYMETYNHFAPLYNKSSQLKKMMGNMVMQVVAENFVNSICYYSTVKKATKKFVVGAEPIYEDLKNRFEKEKRTKEIAPTI